MINPLNSSGAPNAPRSTPSLAATDAAPHPQRTPHRLQGWIPSWAGADFPVKLSRWRYTVIFLAGCAEAVLVPMPLDELLIIFGAANPKRSLRLGLTGVAGATVGSLMGYALGAALYARLAHPLIVALGLESSAAQVFAAYRDNPVEAMLLSGFVPVPYFLFTWLAGAGGSIPPALFAAASCAGRALRLMPTALAVYFFGDRLAPVLHRRLSTVVFTVGALSLLLCSLRWLVQP